MKNINFRNKILSLPLLIIVLFTLAIIISITNSFNSILEEIIFENETNNIAQKAELTAHWLEEKKLDLEIYANTKVVQNGSWPEKISYLQKELKKRDSNYFFFFIADKNGNYSTTLEKDAGNIGNRAYFEQVLNGKTIISDPVISKSTKRPIIVIASPIIGDNLSLLGASIEIKDLSKNINRYTNSEEGIYSFLINGKGKLVAHPQQSISDYQPFYNLNNFLDKQYEFTAEIENKKQGALTFTEKNNKKHAFYHSIPGTNNWKIVTIIPQSYLQKSINKVNKIIIIISIITILIAIILSIFISNNIARPITKLKNTFQKGAAGNLNVRSQINSNDELGEAAASFNKMMEVIKDLSYNDSLTGLPNINIFKKELNKYLQKLQNQKLYLCAIGIDDFKSINDSFGHDVGNKILEKLAQRLTNQLKAEYLVSRVGDEFYFYLTADYLVKKAEIRSRLKQILKVINSNYFIENNIIYLKSSLGVSIYPDDHQNIDILIKNSSLAMHAVKKSSSNKLAFYSLNIDRSISEKKRLENQLATALERDEFLLYYQGFNGNQKDEIVGFETLIRWDHPQKGLISPGIFIPIAEENGFIKEIGTWVLEKACHDFYKLNQKFNSDYYLSVNISPEQFIDPDFFGTVKNILKKTGLKAKNLELEITERTTVENIGYTIEVLQKLNSLGVKTAIDDFGTGYSSLNYLKEFKIHTLKIDKSFIDNFIDNKNNRAIVKSIINLAHNLNLRVVAEGVESKKQAEKLKQAGCDIIQGYYYSYPAPLVDIIKELEKKAADN